MLEPCLYLFVIQQPPPIISGCWGRRASLLLRHNCVARNEANHVISNVVLVKGQGKRFNGMRRRRRRRRTYKKRVRPCVQILLLVILYQITGSINYIHGTLYYISINSLKIKLLCYSFLRHQLFAHISSRYIVYPYFLFIRDSDSGSKLFLFDMHKRPNKILYFCLL